MEIPWPHLQVAHESFYSSSHFLTSQDQCLPQKEQTLQVRGKTFLNEKNTTSWTKFSKKSLNSYASFSKITVCNMSLAPVWLHQRNAATFKLHWHNFHFHTFNGTTFTFSYSHFQVDEQIAAAFKLWSDVTDLTFTPRSYGRLNFKFGKIFVFPQKNQTDLDGVCVCESSKLVDCKYFQRSHRNPVPKSVSRRRWLLRRDWRGKDS